MSGCLYLGNWVGLTLPITSCDVACHQHDWDTLDLRFASDSFPVACALSVVFLVVNALSGVPKYVTYITWLHSVYCIPFVASVVLRSTLCLV